ncbi:MAG: xanthine dehydrogenase family protein molybdopterin-binding subunit, partial [Rhizobiales bacterium]|nr:xanthine dehydrogenase family protein molybdopterin-binding subunit [Hyphomicrobiales bacterium]
DSTVTVIIKHFEMGQGTTTGLPTILAEELDADWAQVKVAFAPSDPTKYNNLLFGDAQGTGGSTAIANSYKQLREAGAAARAVLVQAAAESWNVPAAEITVENGSVQHKKSGQVSSFGGLVAKAATLPMPAQVKLKDPKDFKLIGQMLPRKDSADKARGRTQFTLDVRLPDMLTAVVARAPRFGGTVKSFDATEAKKIKGVVDVVQIPVGIAVLANGFWAASKGREALKIEWDDSKAEMRGSAQIMQEFKGLLDKPGTVARKEGDAEKALAGAAKVIEATYEFPYLAHAPMEPMDCVVQLSADKCEIWSGCQFPSIDHAVASAVSGLKPEQVVINTLYAGGSFGRRANAVGDFTFEAVAIAKAIGGRVPVKLVWTREDDIRGGRYRPLYVHKIRAALGKDGKIAGWHHRIVGQSILAGTPFEGAMVKDGIDFTSVEGALQPPYAMASFNLDLHSPKTGVPVLWWRSVGSSHTAYTVETIIDELAEAAGKDPVEFRRGLMADHPRHLGVLNLAAEKAGWGQPLAKGLARGIAVAESFNSFVAQVAEVRLVDGKPKVERVVCAVDCGVAINPDVIRAQMEGGIGFGLGAILHDEITLTGGTVDQSNFHDYVPLRINEMPKVEVHIVPSSADPTGVGEPGVPPIGPAVANALYKLTKKRIRSLPMAKHELRAV